MSGASFGADRFETDDGSRRRPGFLRRRKARSEHDSVSQRNGIYASLIRRNKIVTVLRFAVPFLGIIVGLFLTAQIIIANIAQEYGFDGISIEGDKIVITTPDYAGIMEDGTRYTVEAEAGRVDANQTNLIDLDLATLKTIDVNDYAMTAWADFAKLDLDAQTVTVPGQMRTLDSDEVEGDLSDVFINWKRQRLTANGDVHFDFPEGSKIDADRLVLNANADTWTFTDPIYTTPSNGARAEQSVVGEDFVAAGTSSDQVTSETLVIDEQANEAFFEGSVVVKRPDVTVWTDALLVAFEGGRLETISQFTATGNVRLEDDVQTVTGDRGVFDPDTEVMLITGDVVVRNQSGIIRAPNLSSNLATHISTFTADGSARVVGDFRSEDDVKVVSDNFVIREDENIAEFWGNVVVDQGKTNVRSQRVIVYLSENGSDRIRYYEAIGNVTVKEPKQTTTGDRARYNPATNRLDMSGNVQVVNQAGTVESNQMSVDLDSNVSTFSSNGNGRVSGVFSPSNSNGGSNAGGGAPLDL